MAKHGPYIEVERCVSGPGLVDIFEFCCSPAAAAAAAGQEGFGPSHEKEKQFRALWEQVENTDVDMQPAAVAKMARLELQPLLSDPIYPPSSPRGKLQRKREEEGREQQQQQQGGSCISSPRTAHAFRPTALRHPAVCALDLFLSCYGRVLQTATITFLPYGGLYVAGGILPQLMWRLRQKNILVEAYLDAGPKMTQLVSRVPVSLIRDPGVGLKGALFNCFK